MVQLRTTTVKNSTTNLTPRKIDHLLALERGWAPCDAKGGLHWLKFGTPKTWFGCDQSEGVYKDCNCPIGSLTPFTWQPTKNIVQAIETADALGLGQVIQFVDVSGDTPGKLFDCFLTGSCRFSAADVTRPLALCNALLKARGKWNE